MKINQEYRKGIMFLRIIGRVDKKTSIVLKNKVEELKEEFKNIVINLDDVTNIDMKGINTLYYIYELTSKNDSKILLCINEGHVHHVLSKYRIFNYINRIDNELNAFNIMAV